LSGLCRPPHRYKDQLGQSLAGTVTRGGSSSRLFETSTIDDSRLGPARVEPTIPVGGSSGPSQPAAVRPAADTPPEWRPKMPDSSWWTRRLHRQQQQQPSPALSDLAAQLDASSKWPVPTIAGDRPPLGLLGRPQGAAAERRICDSRSFGYSMVFGPLLPAACGTFEVGSVPGGGNDCLARLGQSLTRPLCFHPLCSTGPERGGSAAHRRLVGSRRTQHILPSAGPLPSKDRDWRSTGWLTSRGCGSA
jgi:hypothetical protein